MTGSPLQIVPSATCLHCDVCCRFPDRDSFLRPFFTADEIRAATAAGISSEHFPTAAGTPIDLVPSPAGEGYVCPAFDVTTSHCRIYDVRPLDCRLYPFALMWDATHAQVLLGWDSKCPYMRDVASPVVNQAAQEIAQWIEADSRVETLARYPRLIGRFQRDVIALQPLQRLTKRLQQGRVVVPMRALTLSDRTRVETGMRLTVGHDLPLAAASFAYHYVWRHLLSYSWTELHGHICLFAESPDGLFMAMPPLGPGPLRQPLAAAFRFMRERNGDSSATRIENVPEACVAELRSLGYRVTAKDPDYLYAANEVAELSGDPYKSPRAACNRFVREQAGVLEPYDLRDRTACLSLFHEWSEQKQPATDAWGHALLQDAAGAHEAALSFPQELGLTGAVVRVGGRIRAYTMGLWLNPIVFCVLLEVADRTVAGLAPFIFREFCRQARANGAWWINTMDDSGLPSLARSKQWYHPAQLLPSYIVMES